MKTHRSSIICLFAVMLLGLIVMAPEAQADFADWQYRMEIQTVGNTQSETLPNFPLLVVLGTNVGNFSYGQFASTNGGDLRFADSDMTTELNYEVEEWNTSGTSYVWVRLPEMSGTNDTIWAFWGNPSQTSAPTYTINGATWDSQFGGVWHLTEKNGVSDLTDSTFHNRHGVNATASSAPGRISYAHNGTSGAVMVYDYQSWPRAPRTITLFANVSETPS